MTGGGAEQRSVVSWPASDPDARRNAARIVVRAFAWSPAIAALASAATALAAVELAVLVGLGVGSWWLVLWAVIGYPVTVLSLYLAVRLRIRDPAKTWWMLEDHRGKAVVLTNEQNGSVTANYLAAWPRGRGLGYDLMRHVTHDLDHVVVGQAWPSTADRYTGWGAIDCGRSPWRFTHRIEFQNPPTANRT